METLFAGLMALAVLVVVHEFGHFVLAKLFGVGVPVFSVGMGPRLFGFSWGGTDYRISLLPVGGYVQMAGADPFGDPEHEATGAPEQLFVNKPIWQRLLILFGGPAANLILPIVIFSVAAMSGEPVAGSVVGQVVNDSPAAVAGFLEEDRILEVDGQEIEVWSDLEWYLGDEPESSQVVVVDRKGQRITITIPPNSIPLMAENAPLLDKFGLMHRRVRSQIGVSDPTSPAALAGLQTGDAVVSVDGKEVTTWSEMLAHLSPGKPHELGVKRATRVDGEVDIESLTVNLQEVDEWSPRDGEFFDNAWGIAPVEVFIGKVMDEKPAQEAGLQGNDRLFAVNGKPVKDFMQLGELVAQSVEGLEDDLANAGGGGCFGGAVANLDVKPLMVAVIRDGQQMELSFTPVLIGEPGIATTNWRPLMGIYSYPDAWAPGEIVTADYSVPEAAARGVHYTVQTARHIMTSLGGLLTGGLRVKDSVGGPVRIFSVTAQAWAGGLFSYVKLLAVISISLGIVNLLPVPVLDGGQILIYSVEGIRGRPVSPALRERMQMIGVLFLVALFLVVTFFDIEACLTNG